MQRVRFKLALLAALVAAPVIPTPGHAQVVPALAGAGAGFLGGGVATVSLIVARARFEHKYIEGVDDFIGLNGVPVIVGTSTGLAIGLWDEDRLRRSVITATGGMLLGFGTGWIVGTVAGEDRTSQWSAAVIGAGIGLAIGAYGGALWPEGDEDGELVQGELAALRGGDRAGVPLTIRIPFP